MSIIKVYQVKVEWGDCDPYGIVFYPNFYKWMDSSQWSYFNKIKLQILLCFITHMAELVDACGLKPHPLGYRFDSDYEYIFNI